MEQLAMSQLDSCALIENPLNPQPHPRPRPEENRHKLSLRELRLSHVGLDTGVDS